jgi:CDP-diacylglycerol--glycerol-3-phosphate 3-phosphatidyltransferase
MFSQFGRRLFAKPVAGLVHWLQGTGVTPNALTYIGFLLTVVTAFLLAWGSFRIGALVLLIAAWFDMLDGALARITGQSSTFGAFLDSTLDRYSESVTFLALAVFYSRDVSTRTELVLIFIILIGSLMVSYTRARAEALNIECKAGMLQRPERIVLLLVGLLTGWMLPVLWIMAILTNVSAIQRIYEVYWRTSQPATSQPSSAMTNKPPSKPIVNPGDNRPAQS